MPATELVGGYLKVMYVLARPLARVGLPPDVVTFAGLALAGLSLVPAAAGGRWLLLAVAVVVVAGLALVNSHAWSGPVLLTLSRTHGVHAADLPVVALAAFAVALLARTRSRSGLVHA